MINNNCTVLYTNTDTQQATIVDSILYKTIWIQYQGYAVEFAQNKCYHTSHCMRCNAIDMFSFAAVHILRLQSFDCRRRERKEHATWNCRCRQYNSHYQVGSYLMPTRMIPHPSSQWQPRLTVCTTNIANNWVNKLIVLAANTRLRNCQN